MEVRKLTKILEMSELKDFLDRLAEMAMVRGKESRVVKEAEEFLSMQPCKEVKSDPLSVFIIETYEKEMKRNSAQRALRPDLLWGLNYRQQMLEARRDPQYRRELAAITKHHQEESEHLTTHQLRVLAFVRWDRQRTERLLAEAQRDGQEIGDGWEVCSPASLLAECMEERRFLYLEASKRGLMIQSKGNALQLMRRRGGPDAAGGT